MVTESVLVVIQPSPLHLGLADFRQHNMQDQSETAPCLRIGKWASVTSRLSTGVARIGEFGFETKCPVSPTPLHRLCTLENRLGVSRNMVPRLSEARFSFAIASKIFDVYLALGLARSSDSVDGTVSSNNMPGKKISGSSSRDRSSSRTY